MIFVTGDTHGDFTRVRKLCREHNTTKDDILIILGDAGINYAGGERDLKLKENLSELPITLFSIHGNHEMRPTSVGTYELQDFHSGKVYVETAFPNLLFAKDGEIYDFNGLKTIVIGGAYSVDKFYRLSNGANWFADEQPSAEIKEYVEKQLESCNNKIDVILSHTCPESLEPREWFLPFVDQSAVDKTTEKWLDHIHWTTEYKYWLCGHFHGIKKVPEIQFMFKDIMEFPRKEM